MIASNRCSLFLVGGFLQIPLSQIQRGTSLSLPQPDQPGVAGDSRLISGLQQGAVRAAAHDGDSPKTGFIGGSGLTNCRIRSAPGDTAPRLCVRTVPVRRGFLSAAALRSSGSAGTRAPLFAAFIATTPASDCCAPSIIGFGCLPLTFFKRAQSPLSPGSPAAPAWLIASCRSTAWEVLPPVLLGCVNLLRGTRLSLIASRIHRGGDTVPLSLRPLA